jgi:hypothetical protein
VLKTPVRAPKANALAERFVRTIRAEVLDLVLVTGRRHLFKVLSEYEVHYNFPPTAPRPRPSGSGDDRVFSTPKPIRQIERRELLGGLISEYHGSQHDGSSVSDPTGAMIRSLLDLLLRRVLGLVHSEDRAGGEAESENPLLACMDGARPA